MNVTSSKTIYDFSDVHERPMSKAMCITTVTNSRKHEYAGQDKDKKEETQNIFILFRFNIHSVMSKWVIW